MTSRGSGGVRYGRRARRDVGRSAHTRTLFILYVLTIRLVAVGLRVHRQWDGLLVRRESFDRRHPQGFVRAVSERSLRGSPNPEQEDVFIEDAYPSGVGADDL